VRVAEEEENALNVVARKVVTRPSHHPRGAGQFQCSLYRRIFPPPL